MTTEAREHGRPRHRGPGRPGRPGDRQRGVPGRPGGPGPADTMRRLDPVRTAHAHDGAA